MVPAAAAGRPDTRSVTRSLLGGVGLVLAFDAGGAAAARCFGFRYTLLLFGTYAIYLVVTFWAARRYGVLAAVAFGAILGLADQTLGWTIAWLIGPGRPAEPLTVVSAAGAVALSVLVGTVVGILGGAASRFIGTPRSTS